MTEGMQMLEREEASDFVVDDDRTHGIAFEFAGDQSGRDAAFFQIGEHVDIEKEPVGKNDEALDAAIKQHFEIAFETATFVVNIGEDGQVGSLVERVFDAAQNQRAIGIGHVEDHDADRMAALAAQRPGKLVGAVAELFRGTLDALFGRRGNVSRERSVVQHDRDRGGGESALLGYITNCDHRNTALEAMRYDPHRNCVRQSGNGPGGACVAREGWRTLQQRVRRVSSARIGLLVTNSLLAVALTAAMVAQSSSPETTVKPHGTASVASATKDPAEIFRAGQEALNHGQLDAAERDFRAVLAADPQSGAAYANLGVVYMRRKQWTKALEMLHHAERLLPQVPGIRLNIGLAYYRQNEFLKAIPAFESVVRDQPDAVQPRHLLGLCYFFVERWKDAANTLEPLWAQESGQLSYLYVLSIAAHRAGQRQLDEKATAQLVKAGENSPEFHLFMGKAHLNLEQYDMALADFQAAAEANPKLTFVHFNLGLTYLKKQDYEHARDEFLKDVAVEPDLALNYDELGDVYVLMEQDTAAEKSYREALRRDPKLVNSYLGLAKLYQRQGKYLQALSAIDAAAKLDPRPHRYSLCERASADPYGTEG